jgi:acyl-homoserine-lactone acylase
MVLSEGKGKPMNARQSVLIGAMIALAASCSSDSQSATYEATIRYTAYGVPHILADGWANLGFGQGYSATQDRGCIVADQVLKVRGERARFLGRGESDEYLNSDFGYRALGLLEVAERDFSNLPQRQQDLLTGYVAGYNQFLAENGSEGFPGWCAGEEWVRPITPIDYYAYVRDGAMMASGATLAHFIGAAQPPGGTAAVTPSVSDFQVALTELTVHASNGWALGSERTESGRGMVLTNPQFGWHGATQFRENHLTIPGEVDVYGASFGGFPGIQVGFNRNVAWTHTVSEGFRFTVYGLELVPGDPTRYKYDGEERAMTSSDFSVQVRQSDGSLQEVQRTLYFSHYGPMLVVPTFGEWSNSWALTYRDANSDNDEVLTQFLSMNLATSMDEFQQIYDEVSGIPWVNTMAASADGRAWYADGSATPNLSDEALALWQERAQEDVITQLFFDFGVVLLDGSDSRFEWMDEEGARDPGVIPPSKQPKLERRDVVSNANQSHWITNSAAPLEGFSPLMGAERQELHLRARLVAMLVENDSPDGPSGPDGLFSMQELQQVYMVNRGLLGELLLDETVARCQGADVVMIGEQSVDISEACTVLSNWDLLYNLDSVGAVLWRQVWSPNSGTGYQWKVPFDVDDPLGTPRGLEDAPAEGPDPVLQNIAAAVLTLQEAGFDIDVALGDAQFTNKGQLRIPMHGGISLEGVANIAAPVIDFADSLEPIEMAEIIDPDTGLTTAGYYADRGPAIVMAIEFTDDGPRATSIAAYSQSKDPSSPHFADQTELYSMKQFKTVRFTEEEIMSDPELEVVVVRGN